METVNDIENPTDDLYKMPYRERYSLKNVLTKEASEALLKDLQRTFYNQVLLHPQDIRRAFIDNLLRLFTWGSVRKMRLTLEELLNFYNNSNNPYRLYRRSKKAFDALPAFKHINPELKQKWKTKMNPVKTRTLSQLEQQNLL